MRIPFGRPIIEEEERLAVMKVLEGPILVHGPVATEFEEAFAEFTKSPYAVSVSSCTAGMHLAYFAMGFGEGDEIIVPAQTHTATAHAVELTGAKAIFVDCELETGNIDIDKIEEAITPRTKALAVVHYLGVPVDMPRVVEIAKKHDLFLLEDCALAPGAYVDNVHVGLHGDLGVYSFYPVKHFTTAEGGMVITNNKELAEKMKLLKAFGVNRAHGERKVPGMYDVMALGFNYRMSEIHAAIGVEQMKKLPNFLKARRKNFEALETQISSLSHIRVLPQPVSDHLVSCHYCMGIILDQEISSKRAEIMEKLSAEGVGSSIYYPQPVPRMTYYQEKYGYNESLYPNAALISDSIIALPVGQHLGLEDMSYIGEKLKSVLETVS